MWFHGACVPNKVQPRDGIHAARMIRKHSKIAAKTRSLHHLTRKAKPMTVYRDPESNSRITNCIFLNDTDAVLGWSSDGRAMVLRCREQSDDTTTLLGTTRVCRPPNSGMVPPALFRIGNGYSFAVGMETGELRIFLTERMAHLVSNRSSHLQHTPSTTHCLLPSERKIDSWVSRRPLRKYRPIPDISLLDQFANPHRSFDPSTVVPLPQWSDIHCFTRPPRKCARPCALNHQMGWDIRETASSLRAVQVGQHKDMFALRILDDRSDSSKHEIAVDLRQNGPTYHDVCFVNDHIIATSQTDSVVKLWDSRMLQGDDKGYVASFPLDNVYGVSARHTMRGRTKQQFNNAHLTMLDSGSLLAVSEKHITTIDPFRGRIEREMEYTKADSDFGCVVAVDPTHGVVAQGGACSPTIELWESILYQGHSKKRKAEESSNRLSIAADLKDCYECDAEKSSLGTLIRKTSVQRFLTIARSIQYNRIASRLCNY